MKSLRVFWLAVAVLAAASATAGAQIVIDSMEPLLLRDGAGSARLVLRNKGPYQASFNLSAGVFADLTSHIKLPAAKVTFAPETGALPFPTIPVDKTQTVLVSVTGLNGVAAAEARLLNGAEELTLPQPAAAAAKAQPALHAVSLDVQLNMALSGAGTTEKPLQLTYKHPVELAVKNNSKDTLTVDWSFQIGNIEIKSGQIVLTAGEDEPLIIENNPAKYTEVFSWKDFIRPSQRQGRLILRLHMPEGISPNLAPAVTLPVELTMMRFSKESMEIIFAGWLMIFLLFGGLISLLGASVLPNILRKIGMHRKIGELADRTSSVSTRVDSYLRVLLRLERSKIDAALKEIGPMSLSSSERFEEVEDAIEKLSRRLSIVERLDTLRRNFDEISCSAPPSLSGAIDHLLRTAARQMHSFALPDQDVSAATLSLDKAEGLLGELTDDAAQAARILGNFKVLIERARTFPPPYFADFKQALPGLFQILDTPEDEIRSIVPPMFFAVDHSIAAVHLAFDYAMVRASVAVDTDEIAGIAGREIRERQQARECELMEALGTLSWRSLRLATLLVRQLRENLYDVDILAEMGKRRPDGERRVRIVFDAQRARPYMPVNFSVSFDDPRFKDAAALEALSFRWTFPDEHVEEGVKVCHYFTGSEAKLHHSGKLKIVLSVQSQRNLTAATTIEGTIEVKDRRPRQTTRAVAEFVRFAITFGVALAALEAGALDRLVKLDLLPATLAVIALGYGADSIKNMLTQGTKKPAQ